MKLLTRLKQLFSPGLFAPAAPSPLSIPSRVTCIAGTSLPSRAAVTPVAKFWADPCPRVLCEMSDAAWTSGRHFELVVADNSTSMRESSEGRPAIDILTVECGKFLDRLGDRDAQDARVAFIWFASDSVLAVPWTTALAEVGPRAFGNLPPPGNTNFVAAVLAAAEMVRHQPFPAGASVAVRLFTDGKHNQAGEPLQAAEELKRLGVTLHCIGCGDREEHVDATLLRQMASRNAQGEAMYEFAGTPGDLERVLNEVVDGLERWNP